MGNVLGTANSIIDIYHLSETFYNDYPKERYPELLEKSDRPYSIALFEYTNDYLVGVPFRSYMRHKIGFRLYESVLSNGRMPGLDYSKIVIINKENYINPEVALINEHEMTIFQQNIATISEEVQKYVVDYVNYMNGEITMHKRYFERKYQYSTLKYFHNELHIND